MSSKRSAKRKATEEPSSSAINGKKKSRRVGSDVSQNVEAEVINDKKEPNILEKSTLSDKCSKSKGMSKSEEEEKPKKGAKKGSKSAGASKKVKEEVKKEEEKPKNGRGKGKSRAATKSAGKPTRSQQQAWPPSYPQAPPQQPRPTMTRDVRMPGMQPIQQPQQQQPVQAMGPGTGNASSNPVVAEPQESRRECIQRYIAYLVHACHCRNADCRMNHCYTFKRAVKILMSGRASTTHIGKQLTAICCYHSRCCTENICPVPFCVQFKQKLLLALAPRSHFHGA